MAVPVGFVKTETPPEDDVCPVCFGEFVLPCRANCGHWFCGSCILEVWNFSSAFQACKCPMCCSHIKTLKPGAFPRLQDEEEARKVLKSIKRYNRLFAGGASGFFLASLDLYDLPLLLRRIFCQMIDPNQIDRHVVTWRLLAILLGFLYMISPTRTTTTTTTSVRSSLFLMRQSTPLVESRHEADQGETFVAASRQGRKRKNSELEKSPNFNNSAEERAEELSSGPISVPSCAETSSPFLVSFPPASEAPDIMSRMCPPEFTTALRHLSNEQIRIEATRSFALTTCHVRNLLASHEALEETNSRRQALIDELSRENKELSKSTGELKGEMEKLKSALLEKEEREVKLKDAEGDELEHVHEPEPAAELEMEVEPGPFVYLPMIEPEPFVDLPLIMDVDPPIPDVDSTSTPPLEFSWDEMFVRFAAFELRQEATLVRLQALQAEITREIREQLDAAEVYITEQYFGRHPPPPDYP